jgi:hypothetical protein
MEKGARAERFGARGAIGSRIKSLSAIEAKHFFDLI